MLKELLLLRHAKSDHSQPDLTDFDRPLAERGKQDAHTIGNWMLSQQLIPDHIIVSPAKRTLQTLKRVRSYIDPNNAISCQEDERIYEAPHHQLLRALADAPSQAHRILLVGHNPGLEELLHHLICAPEALTESRKLFPTSALAQIILPSDWKNLPSNCGKLVDLWRVKELPVQ